MRERSKSKAGAEKKENQITKEIVNKRQEC